MEYRSSDIAISIITQTLQSIDIIFERSKDYKSGDDYRLTPMGMMVLDSICMQFIAIGESMKRFDRLTEGKVLCQFSDIPWRQLMGLRDIVAHKYFDIDADQIHWIIANELDSIKTRLQDILDYLTNDELK